MLVQLKHQGCHVPYQHAEDRRHVGTVGQPAADHVADRHADTDQASSIEIASGDTCVISFSVGVIKV